MKTYTIYILRCSDKSYYTGVTSNLDKRIIEHQSGKHPDAYTFNRRPVELMYIGEFQYISQAIAHEKQVKGWSRKKKEALIEDNWEEVVRLSNLKK
ncbi:MAG: putative endonuclease [Spirosomataceae bacterium]|jgi:putative endonuclease